MKNLVEIFVSFFGCFLAVYWLPFARMSFSIDAFTTTILNPVDFLLGGISFLMGFIFHSKLMHKIRKLKSFFRLDKRVAMIILLGYILPISLVIFSLKVVVSFFIFSTIYGIISLSSPIHTDDKRQKGEL